MVFPPPSAAAEGTTYAFPITDHLKDMVSFAYRQANPDPLQDDYTRRDLMEILEEFTGEFGAKEGTAELTADQFDLLLNLVRELETIERTHTFHQGRQPDDPQREVTVTYQSTEMTRFKNRLQDVAEPHVPEDAEAPIRQSKMEGE